MFEEGNVNNVPLMIGTTSQEAVLFIYRAYTEGMNVSKYKYHELLIINQQTLNYDELLLGAFPLHYEAMHKLYHTSNSDKRELASVSLYKQKFNNIIMILQKLGTDEVFICSTKYAARTYSNHTSGVSQVYHYIFDHVWSFEEGWKPYSVYNACRNASCMLLYI